MVETGEISGNIDEVMERLAINYEREHNIKEKVKSSMTYPLVILIVAIIGVTAMLIFVIPMLVRHADREWGIAAFAHSDCLGSQ
ncbi:MAG: type II secretion system F family protein [Bacillota bacterium]